MALRRGLALAIAIAIAAMTDASAQFAPPVPKPPCYDDFMPLREETQKRAAAISAAGKRNAEPKEICESFARFAEAEAKLIQFVEHNGAWCGISAEALTQMKEGQRKAAETRKRVCAMMTPPASPPKIWTPVSPPNIWMGPPASPPPRRIWIAAFPPDFTGCLVPDDQGPGRGPDGVTARPRACDCDCRRGHD